MTRTALAALTVLVASCLLGPLVIDEGPSGDPAGSSLLPPLTSVTVLDLREGEVVVAPRAQRVADAWVVESARRTRSVPASRVVRSRQHRYWLGSDRLGRDVLDRMLRGGRVSLAIAGLSLLLALVVGVAVGVGAATGGRLLDGVLMRLVDALLAFPLLFLLILLAAVLRPGPGVLVAVLALGAWMGTARLVRGQVLSLRQRTFVLAARALGTPRHRIWRVHLLPHVAGPLAQDSALRLGDLVLAEATLSYLGLGVPATMPSWGGMVAEGHQVLLQGWWISTFPGLAIAALVITLALLGDSLQRRLDVSGTGTRKRARRFDVHRTETLAASPPPLAGTEEPR